jgi:tetratricopeptide (TPR) repeat protein
MELPIDQTLQQGIAAHKEGRIKEAEHLYRAILKSQPTHPDANHNLGLIAVSVGEADAALPYLKMALETNSKQEQFWLSYIQTLITLGKLGSAKHVLQQGKDIGLKTKKLDQLELELISDRETTIPLQELNQRFITLYNQGKLEEALDLGTQLVRKYPAAQNILGMLGMINSILGKHEEAITHYEKLIELNSHSPLLYHSYSSSLSHLDQTTKALKSASKAIFLKPDYADAYYNLGTLYTKLQRNQEAICMFKRTIQLKPDHAQAYNSIGISLFECGEQERGVTSLKKSIELKPCSQIAIHNLANAYYVLAKYEEAIRLYQVVGLAKENGKILECLYRSNRFPEFYKLLRILSKSDKCNIRISAISAFVAHQLKKEDPYPFCKNPIDFFHLGSLTAYTSNVEKFAKDLILEAENMPHIWEPRSRTTVNGFQTHNNIFPGKAKVGSLKKIIEKEIQHYYSKFASEDCSFIRNWPAKSSLYGWYVRLVKNGYQEKHIHADGWLSGIVYLKTIDCKDMNEGAIELGLHGYDLPIIDEDYPRKIHRPNVGDIILFPSSLFHRTIPFREDTERCVIAFDIVPIKS